MWLRREEKKKEKEADREGGRGRVVRVSSVLLRTEKPVCSGEETPGFVSFLSSIFWRVSSPG